MARDLLLRGVLRFHFDDNPQPWEACGAPAKLLRAARPGAPPPAAATATSAAPRQQVHVFRVTSFDGEPAESDEMAPAWFHRGALPFGSMWADDVHWYPLFLSDRRFEARPRPEKRRRRLGSAGRDVRNVSAVQGTFWFRETTRLVSHTLQAVPDHALGGGPESGPRTVL